MTEEQDKLKLKIERAEAAVALAQKLYEEAEPGSVRDSCLQLLLAEEASLLADKKALEQVREKELLQQRAAAGMSDAGQWLSLPPGYPVASQWQPLVTRAIAELLAASVPGLADNAVSDIISLGGSEPALNNLAQAAENLNVAIHPRVTAPSSGKHSASKVEWHGDKEDASRNINQVLAILQEHVCDGKSQAVSVTSRDIFNSTQFPAQFSAKRIKLSPTKTDCLIVAKFVAELAVQNPRSIYHQLFGMVKIKRPVPFKSRLDTWRAQAQAQFLGVNYIVSHCATQQPIGSGIPVLLTSFEDGQAILFTGKPDRDRDGISEVWFDSTADALEIFKLGVATRQAAAVHTISLSDLRDEIIASAAPRVGQAGELSADNSADPDDLSAVGPPQLSMRARFDLAQADYLASLQSAMNPLVGHADLPDLAYWLPYVNTVIQTVSGGTHHLPAALHDIMHEQIRQHGPPDNMFT